MVTWKEKARNRFSALKDIGTNLVELAWLLFAAIQWIFVFTLPAFFVASIICYIANSPLSITAYDTDLISFWGCFFTYLSFLVYMGFAYFYIFKIRDKGEPSFHYKFQLLFLYIVIYLLFGYRVQLAEKNYILNNLRHSETTVHLYDSETKQLLLDNISSSEFSRSVPQIFPLKSSTSVKPGEGFHYELINIKPAEVALSAPGYESKKVLIGTQEGEQTISVYLEKEKLNDPNLPMAP